MTLTPDQQVALILGWRWATYPWHPPSYGPCISAPFTICNLLAPDHLCHDVTYHDAPPPGVRVVPLDNIPNFTTDASADYQSLQFVREKLLFSRRQAFIKVLHDIVSPITNGKREMMPDCFLKYKPGDYSRALLKIHEK